MKALFTAAAVGLTIAYAPPFVTVIAGLTLSTIFGISLLAAGSKSVQNKISALKGSNAAGDLPSMHRKLGITKDLRTGKTTGRLSPRIISSVDQSPD